ncbi:MAG: multidrug effflux MFS transporter [Alphaproteobacteria bacterium]
MSISFFRAAIVLGLLSAAGPIAIDMYLPALPTISVSLNSSVAGTQMSLMAYFVAITLFQSVYGPLSDMVGRRPPLFVGLSLYALAGIGCAFAPNIEVLIALRFVQGVGACAGMIIPRAVVRDLYTGVTAARLMALIMLVFSIGPILAPFFGSLIAETLGWRMIFIAIAAVGVASLVLLTTALPETRTKDQRMNSSVSAAIAGYRVLFRDPRFLATGMLNGFGLSMFFSFIAGSPFVYIDHYGLSPFGYSVAFGINAAGFFGTAQLNGRIGMWLGLRRMVRIAIAASFTFIALGFLYFLAGGDELLVLMASLFLSVACLGLVIPASSVLAMEAHGPIAGTASSLLGTIQFGAGTISIAVMSLVGDGSALPLVSVVAASAMGGLLVSFFAMRERPD